MPLFVKDTQVKGRVLMGAKLGRINFSIQGSCEPNQEAEEEREV